MKNHNFDDLVLGPEYAAEFFFHMATVRMWVVRGKVKPLWWTPQGNVFRRADLDRARTVWRPRPSRRTGAPGAE